MVKSRRYPSSKVHETEVGRFHLRFTEVGAVRTVKLREGVLTFRCSAIDDGEVEIEMFADNNASATYQTSEALRVLTKLATQRVMANVR